MHQAGVVHRDVKPENIILNDVGRPVLIDFNISASAANSLTTRVGTWAYMAPEVTVDGGRWTSAADIYSLGACLSELVAGQRLRGNAPAWADGWTSGDELEALRSVLLLMLSKDPASRPDGVRVARLLEDAVDQFASVRAVPTIASPPIYVKAGANHNPYMDRLIGLFSQSSRSNSGTRGLDDFRRWLYVETRIDRELRPAVVSGGTRLLVISGNAGDGKTAFIRMIEEELKARGATVVDKQSGNGARLSYQGLQFLTNWDGSQDEGDSSNDDVLTDFFSPFAGDSPRPPRTLLPSSPSMKGGYSTSWPRIVERFEWLERELLDVLHGAEPSIAWLSVVNLNLRSLTTILGDGEPIVGQLLARMADDRLWESCSTCVVRDDCYARANAAALRDPVLGPRSVERIRQALDLVRLRRRMHITMRDLMSALAFIVAGNRPCGDIVRLHGAHRCPRS